MKPNHIPSLDWLRGIAAIMVCFFHLSTYLNNANILKICSQYGYLGVDIFFVISGFIIPYSLYCSDYKISNFGKFFLRRLIRIEPPYIISIILCVLLLWISTLSPLYRGNGFNVSWLGLLSHIGYLTSFTSYGWINPVYWTLAIEFQYYISIGLLMFCFNRAEDKIIKYVTIIILLILAILIPDKRLVFHYFPLFIVGIIIFQYKVNILKKVEFRILSVISFIVLFITSPIPTVLAATFSYVFINWINFKSKISEFLGNISFSLYLIHVPLGSRIVNFADNFCHTELLKSIVVFVSVFIAIFLAWLFYYFIEKPFMMQSKKIKY